jgi:hypothetical protein
MLKLTTSHGASVKGSHPLKIAKGGASSVVVVQARKGWATPPSATSSGIQTLMNAETENAVVNGLESVESVTSPIENGVLVGGAILSNGEMKGRLPHPSRCSKGGYHRLRFSGG